MQVFVMQNHFFLTEDKKHVCPKCSKTFDDKSNYNRHVLNHEKITYQCTQCEKTYENKASFVKCVLRCCLLKLTWKNIWKFFMKIQMKMEKKYFNSKECSEHSLKWCLLTISTPIILWPSKCAKTGLHVPIFQNE